MLRMPRWARTVETTGSAVTARTHVLHVEAEGKSWLVDVDDPLARESQTRRNLDRLAE